MRKVNRDELVFVIYHELRNWGIVYRRQIFVPNPSPLAGRASIPAQKVAEVLRRVEIIDPSRPEAPLTRDEITERMLQAIEAFPGAIGKLWLSAVPDRQKEARQTAAILLAQALDPYFVLSNGIEMTIPRHPHYELVPHAMRDSWP